MSTSVKASVSTGVSTAEFDAMDRDLQGRQKVVVSKGTLAKVSRQHSQILRRLVMDVAFNKAGLQKLQSDWATVDDLQERVTSLERQLQVAQETIRQQQETLDKQSEIMEYGKRMDAIMANIEHIMEENKVRDEQLRDQRSDHDSLEDKVSLATRETKEFREGLQTGRTTISSKAVYVEVEKAQLSEVMHSRKSTLKRLDESIFECKESLDRKGDADDLEQCQQDVQAQHKSLIGVKSCLAAVGIDTDGGDGEGVPGGVFVEMANNIKEQKAQLKDTSELCRQLQVGMLDKADVRHVDAKIEQKYQEVVDHLQKAISAAADDEVEFKRVATELQLTVKQLMNSKADQKALLELKEQILNDSRLLDQLAEMRSGLDTKIDRTEAVEMVASKPDRREIMMDVKRQLGHALSKVNVDSGPEAGWATRTSPPASRPGTSEMRGNKSLLCISCNSTLNTGTTGDRPSSSPAVAQAAYARHAATQSHRDTTSTVRNAPVMGPGGPALGGGFHVRLPDQRTARQPARMLPKLQTRSGTGASRIIIGANGIVYQAADAAYMHPHHYPQGAMAGQPAAALRHAQSLPPTAFADNMPGTSRDDVGADESQNRGGLGPDLGGEAYPDDEERGRGMRFAPPETDEGSGSDPLVKPVSVTTHEPDF